MVMMSFGLFSQSTIWRPHDTNLDTAWGCQRISAVDSNIVWAVGEDRHHSAAASIRFTRTQNSNTFISGTFLADTIYYNASNITATNDSVAFITCYSKDATRCGIIMKTMNRGVTWTNVADTAGTMYNTSSFPDWTHFYNNNRGITLGDPNGGNFEIWHTYDGGATWSRTPNASITPTPSSTEYGIVDDYTWYGKKHLWFGTSHSANAVPHVYRSNDTGHTWQGATVAGMLGGVSGLAFRDSLNGLCWGYTALTGGKFLVKGTHDGGATWATVIQHNNVGQFDISAVPGRNAYISVGLDSAGNTGYMTSVTYDDGLNWNVLEIGTQEAQRMIQLTMLDSAHGWAGTFSDNTLPKGLNGMDTWMGAPIAKACPLNVAGSTAICSGSTVTLTANGGAATYTWSANAGSATTNTVSVNPTSTTVYTVNSAVSGCTNMVTYTLNVTTTPTVAVASTATNDSICIGNSTTLNASGVATSYSWTPTASITGTGASVVAHPTVTTTYTLTGHTGTCIGTNTITISVGACVGINQLTVNGTSVSFYPNPSNGLVTVNLYNVKPGTTLNVSDLLGNEVYKTSVNTNSLNQNMNLDLSSLPKGIYLFGVSNGNQSKVQKLIIQ